MKHLYKQNGKWHVLPCKDFSAFCSNEGAINLEKEDAPPKNEICKKCLDKFLKLTEK